MGIKNWLLGHKIDNQLDEIKEIAKEQGIEVNFTDTDELADFADDLQETFAKRGLQDSIPDYGTTLKGTFDKAVEYTMASANLVTIQEQLHIAKELGQTDLVEALGGQVDEMVNELDDMEKDMLLDYINLKPTVDLETMQVQRNYDANGNVTGVGVTMNIEDKFGGSSVDMKTDVELNNGKINKISIDFDR